MDKVKMDLGPYKPILGTREFFATTFTRHDGRKIDILPLIEL